jgi:hypothetical protein
MTMRLLLILLGLLILISEADAARWRWPWEVHRTHHSRHHPRQRVKPPPPPNCMQINEAVKALDAEHMERALRSSTKGQRRIIAACLKRDR